MAARGWDELDVLVVTGDGYVDHASFGGAAIGRLLEARGYRVGILDLPEVDGWDRLPAPRLFVGVTAGTIDSMVTNYTASKHRRKQDVYRPPGMPQRPNRATIAYTAEARRRFPGVPVVVGGLEAGPRRLAYFDFWEEMPRRSILVDSKADLLVWGMAERQVLEVAERLTAAGPDADAKAALAGLRGTVEFAPKGYDEAAAWTFLVEALTGLGGGDPIGVVCLLDTGVSVEFEEELLDVVQAHRFTSRRGVLRAEAPGGAPVGEDAADSEGRGQPGRGLRADAA